LYKTKNHSHCSKLIEHWEVIKHQIIKEEVLPHDNTIYKTVVPISQYFNEPLTTKHPSKNKKQITAPAYAGPPTKL
jgi:hypothetical protein